MAAQPEVPACLSFSPQECIGAQGGCVPDPGQYLQAPCTPLIEVTKTTTHCRCQEQRLQPVTNKQHSCQESTLNSPPALVTSGQGPTYTSSCAHTWPGSVTSSMADSSISRGASEDSRPWVAITKILYAPLSFRVSAAARKLSTSSMMSSWHYRRSKRHEHLCKGESRLRGERRD